MLLNGNIQIFIILASGIQKDKELLLVHFQFFCRLDTFFLHMIQQIFSDLTRLRMPEVAGIIYRFTNFSILLQYLFNHKHSVAMVVNVY